jgi:hypothetical protein
VIDLLKQRNVARRIGQTEVIEKPPLYLPWAQRALNPFPLGSSGTHWGDMAQPWAAYYLAYYVDVYVVTTNNGTNFWTIDLTSDDGTTVIASVNTSAVAANGWRRLSDLTITQPATTNAVVSIKPTATLSPGSIFIAPAVALLRTA